MHVEPVNRSVLAKPSHLPFGELTDGDSQFLDELVVAAEFVVQIARDKTVFEPEVVKGFVADARFEPLPHLVDHALLQADAQALGYPLPQEGPLPRNPDFQHVVTRTAGPGRRDFTARKRHFARTHKPPLVIDVEEIGHPAGFFTKQLHQLRNGHGLQPLAQPPVGPGVDQIVAVGHGIDIEPCSAYQKGLFPPAENIVYGGIGLRLIVREREIGPGIGYVEQVVRHGLPLPGRHLARAKVVAA